MFRTILVREEKVGFETFMEIRLFLGNKSSDAAVGWGAPVVPIVAP